MRKNLGKFYVAIMVLAAGYILHSLFSNKKVLGTQAPVRETVE